MLFRSPAGSRSKVSYAPALIAQIEAAAQAVYVTRQEETAPYLPLSQLLQPDPQPPIDWGALRLHARRDLGVTKADTMIDSLLRTRDLIRKTGSTLI